jgi:hypothetical protein
MGQKKKKKCDIYFRQSQLKGTIKVLFWQISSQKVSFKHYFYRSHSKSIPL